MHFMKFVPSHSDQKILLILDGHKSHVSVGLVEWANTQGIILYILPAHTSHLLQPMDVGCYGPLQRIYNSLCHKFMRETSGTITRYNICELACKAYTRALSAENLQAAFRRTSIFPLDKDAIAKEFLIPSEVFIADNSVEAVDDDVDNDSDATVEGGVFVETKNVDIGVNETYNETFFKNKENELKRIKSNKKTQEYNEQDSLWAWHNRKRNKKPDEGP